MELPSLETIAALVQRHRDSLGLQQIDQVETALLGQGEANLNVLVTVNQAQRFNLRIGLQDSESERTLQREYDVLQLVPAGVGPRALAVDLSRTQLPQPYMLLDYVAGVLKTRWDIADLEAHARTLARLHQQKFVQHGAIGQLADPPYDFLHRFDTGVTYWQTHHPYLLDIPVVQRLLPAIRQFIGAHTDPFAHLQRFTLVHGDAHPLNILFQGDRVAYIDWEWAAIGDPALDHLERQHSGPAFPVGVYERIWCFKSGIPQHLTAQQASLHILGIGRIGPVAGVTDIRQAKYVQPYEQKRIAQLGHTQIELLLSHDSARNAVTPGYGMDEIREVPDRYQPLYHVYGHTGEPFYQRRDGNEATLACKLADLSWDMAQGRIVNAGSMAILHWEGREQHQLEVVDAPWYKEYSRYTWEFL